MVEGGRFFYPWINRLNVVKMGYVTERFSAAPNKVKCMQLEKRIPKSTWKVKYPI